MNRFADISPVDNAFVNSAFRLLDVDTQTGRGVCLRVCVHNEHFLFQGGE